MSIGWHVLFPWASFPTETLLSRMLQLCGTCLSPFSRKLALCGAMLRALRNPRLASSIGSKGRRETS